MSDREDAIRRIAGYAAIAFILPYLVLKIAWIFGVPVGLLDKSLASDPRMLALNILTFAMDAVAVFLALAFSRSWGLRLPAWPLLVPMWVATGFLVPIIVTVPVAAFTATAAPVRPIVEPWTRAVVFGSFIGQGLALITAFVLYVRARCGPLLGERTSDLAPPRRFVVVAGNAASLLAAFGGVLQVARSATSFRLLHLTLGAAALAASIGIAIVVNRIGRRPLGQTLGLTWIGAAVMFSWGAWLSLAGLMNRAPDSAAWLQAAAGLLIGFVAARVAEALSISRVF